MIEILTGDCAKVLGGLPPKSVHCVVTSPPYFGLRDYGESEQTGQEYTPQAHIERVAEVFQEVWRVLRDDGTLRLNYGDSHAPCRYPGIKEHDLIGMPWMVAFALRDCGWHLRSDIIWHKPSPMPESVVNRPTKSHEYIFLMSKSKHYYYDHSATIEKGIEPAGRVYNGQGTTKEFDPVLQRTTPRKRRVASGFRNKRDVWTVASTPFPGAHFATFPKKLIEPCIAAGCPDDGVVLDPFAGTGTVGIVADELGKNALLIELNSEYVRIAEKRISEERGAGVLTSKDECASR